MSTNHKSNESVRRTVQFLTGGVPGWRGRTTTAVCFAALSIAALLAGIGRLGAQAKPGVDKAGGEKVVPPKVLPIELNRCLISLVDEVTLACDRAGIADFIGPHEGDAVIEGQLVARLQDDVAKATLAIAASEAESDVDVRYSEMAARVAEVEHRKAEQTNRISDRAIPAVEVLRLKLAWDKTLLETEAARHRQTVNGLKRNEAQAQLDTFRVKAPFSGVVTKVHRHKGEGIRQGEPILELVNTKRVRVEGLVDIRDLWNVKPGIEVQVRLDIPAVDLEVEKQVFKGKVVFVDVKAEPVSQKVIVWAEVDNPDNILRAGLFANMTVYPEGAPPANGGK